MLVTTVFLTSQPYCQFGTITLLIFVAVQKCFGDVTVCQHQVWGITGETLIGQVVLGHDPKDVGFVEVEHGQIPHVEIIPHETVVLKCICYVPQYFEHIVYIGIL